MIIHTPFLVFLYLPYPNKSNNERNVVPIFNRNLHTFIYMSKEKKYLHIVFLFLFFVLTLLIAGSLFWNINKTKKNAIEFAKIEAEASFQKDILYRQWASIYGGVYVKVPHDSIRNPYLTFHPQRDITLADSTMLTLINPAYMTRQVYTLAKEKDDYVQGHITSLNPINPINKADNWERRALIKFESESITDYSSIDTINNEQYLRYIHILKAEKNCLMCHQYQGYALNDVRGGIGVAVPLTKYLKASNTQVDILVISHIAVYIAIISLLYIGYSKLLQEYQVRHKVQLELLAREKELIIAKQQADQSNRLKTVFLHNISHEIRTPLNAILGFGSLLVDSNTSLEKHKTYSNIVVDNGKKLLAIIEDILTISTIETKNYQLGISTSILSELIENAVQKIKNETNNNIAISINYPKETTETEITTDIEILRSIINILLSNAIKFTEKGSIAIGYCFKGDFVEFFVKDTGIGIAQEHQEIIFEQFQQANDKISVKYRGTGLGLSIAKAYTEILGGQIWVKSKLNVGSTFYFSIKNNS